MVNPAGAATDFRILGPVEVVRDGQALRLGGRRQRALVALLLLEPGRRVSVDRLIDELWPGEPPRGAERTLRVYVSRLRAALGDEPLLARPPGYVLEIAADRLDAHRFERLFREGREALARGAAGLAATRLRAALSLWRGPALADVAEGGVLALEAERLDELRLACREERIEAELALGRHGALVSELERLVANEPLRERLWRQLVTALYRSERQADALSAYQRARSVLADELGLEPGEELRALERAVLRHELAQPAPAPERHNLPAELTSFVGREQELDELDGLLREHRLVTLTGVGGAGKTRLALKAAQRQVGAWTGGVWLVDLTAHTDPALVPSAVARALDVVERPDVSPLQALLDHLRTDELLLVLDNCEHLAAACGELVHEVLRSCAHVRVLATSRIALGVPGEIDDVVEPLPTPGDDVPADQIERFPSVRLFLERGRAARQDLDVGGAAALTAGRICRELDGLPLAIELAAARANMLSLDEIATRLDDRFRFLRSWRRVADPRHKTLRATLDWSYELLSEAERDLLDQLSVFTGGFTLEGVAAVCLGRDETLALEQVERLVESSLVVADRRDGSIRFRLLEMIRQYAAERLDAPRAHSLRRAHAEYFLEFVMQARIDDEHDAERKRQVLVTLDQERDNLHAAVEWTLEHEQDLALPLAAALWRYWLIRGYRRQGLTWLEQALALPGNEASQVRAVALAGAALLARLAGEFERAEPLAREAISLGRDVGPPMALTTSLNVLTTLAGRAGDYDRARALSDESVAVARRAGSTWLEGIALFILAEAALHGERYDEAVEAAGGALELARARNDPEVMALALARLGLATARVGRLEEARGQLCEALEHVRALGFPETGAWCCEALALVAAEWGDAERAVRLLGAADALRRAGGRDPSACRGLDPCRRACRRARGAG